MFDFEPFINTVKCYPYRTAKVHGACIKIGIETNEARIFVADLAKAAGASEDNHVVYEIKHKQEENAAPIYVWVTDNHMLIGTKLIEEAW